MALIFPISIPSGISIYNYVNVENVKYVNNGKSNIMLDIAKQKNTNKELKQDIVEYVHENNNEMFKNNIRKFFAFAWLIVFMALLIKRISTYLNIGKGEENEIVKDERIILLLEKCKGKLNIKKDIKMIRQESIPKPATIGIFNVKILVTDYFLGLDDIALSGILLHELSHYKRKDNVMNFIILILKSIYWFNPLFYFIFRSIRKDMEFATDEIAVGKMNLEELKVYCNMMIIFSAANTLEAEEILGLAANSKSISKRINMISLKEHFEEKTKIIFTVTFVIMLVLCLLFYPTSYGMNKIPRLYLKLEDGSKVEINRVENNDISGINEIKLTENQELKLMVKNKKPNDYIFYNVMNFNTLKADEEITNVPFGKLSYFKSGEYVYHFILVYGDNESADYAIKIIVE